MLHGIRNIVFDLGGVVIDLRRDSAVEALERLGVSDAGQLLDTYCQRGPFLELETGRMAAAAFFDEMRGRCLPGTSDIDIQNAFNAFLIRLPEERLSRLLCLRKAGYRVYALSNTNPVMFGSWIADAFRQQGLQINDYFDGVVASFQEGTCKPDVSIFSTVLRRYCLDPAETVMLDDSPANCAAAEQAGMRSLRVGPAGSPTDMMHLTDSWLIP